MGFFSQGFQVDHSLLGTIRAYLAQRAQKPLLMCWKFCLETGSGLANDVTAILGFEELIHPRGPVPVGMGIGAVQAR